MVVLDGSSLTCAQVAAVARHRERVTLAAPAVAAVAASHARAGQVGRQRPVYGQSTGVGANRQAAVAEGDGQQHALALLRSHASSAGPLMARERVRAMLVVRLNQLAAGGSGVSPEVLEGLARMLSADALPAVREHGGVGTGDLGALATTALALLGEAPTGAPLPGPVRFGPRDALPFLSSNAASLGTAALAAVRLEELLRAGVVVATLTLRAVDGNTEAFAPEVMAFPGSQRVAERVRALVPGGAAAARIQDPFGLRTLPQVHGLAVDAVAALEAVVARLANAAAENPLFPPGADPPRAVHHGGFHAAYLTAALDAARLAVVGAGRLSLARLALLVAPEATGLAPFLADATPGASGVMPLEYVGAAALAELRHLATPAGLGSAVLSRGQEEDASFAPLAARHALQGAEELAVLLGCELVAGVRAIGMRRLAVDGALGRAVQLCHPLSGSPGWADRDLTGDLEAARDLLPALAGLLG